MSKSLREYDAHATFNQRLIDKIEELEARIVELENPIPRPITAARVLERNCKRIEAILNKEPHNE